MIMAFGAAYRKTQKCVAKGVGAVDHVFGLKLFLDDAAFHILLVVAIEGGCNPHFFRRIRHKVAGQLPLYELVVMHVFIECIDHPVAVR
ncbi:hypothetical protein D3C87_1847780 [compost metagenome]